jgi:hypothetical protein
VWGEAIGLSLPKRIVIAAADALPMIPNPLPANVAPRAPFNAVRRVTLRPPSAPEFPYILFVIAPSKSVYVRQRACELSRGIRHVVERSKESFFGLSARTRKKVVSKLRANGLQEQ